MPTISVQLPGIDAEHKIEIDVKINGNRRKHHYRVEIFEVEDWVNEQNRALFLREKINEYDRGWQLVYIGQATSEVIPVMFKSQAAS